MTLLGFAKMGDGTAASDLEKRLIWVGLVLLALVVLWGLRP